MNASSPSFKTPEEIARDDAALIEKHRAEQQAKMEAEAAERANALLNAGDGNKALRPAAFTPVEVVPSNWDILSHPNGEVGHIIAKNNVTARVFEGLNKDFVDLLRGK